MLSKLGELTLRYSSGLQTPSLRNTPFYQWLRRGKALVRSHVQAAKLQREVEHGFRLVPERELEDCLRAAFKHLQADDPGEPHGDYLEFGVCHGASMACMHRVAQELGFASMRLFGFDSFEGLPPEADLPGEGMWRPGEYRSYISFTRKFLDKAGVDWGRTALIKGWFRDTLTPETLRRHGIARASVIMIDCDIYSSTREALAFCAPLIGDRAVILFDDWHAENLAERGMGEKPAFDEFLASHRDLRATPLPSYAPNAEVFLIERNHGAC